ncbi:MAG: cupin domain-containing protein [Pseudomonadota bacterium]|nr:cupin domain-containing protein [Pseudomonadota bacterium]
MNRIALSLGTVLFTLAPGVASAQQHSTAVHTVVEPGEVAWRPAPPSLPAGAQAALLYGDPSKEGLFVLRLKLPKGYKIPPHSHPRPEIITVVSGAFHLGMGHQANWRQARRLPAGSFFAFDPGMVHFAHVEEETVVQLNSTGPWGINYVNPADDPRRK